MPKKTLKIEEYGLNDDVIALRKKGLSYQKIADKLNEKYQTTINYMDVKRFLDKHYLEIAKEVSRDDSVKKEALKEFNEITKQLKILTDEMWDYFNKLKMQDELDPTMISAANQLLKLLSAQYKLLSGVVHSQKPTVNQKISIINITDSIDKMMMKLKEYGYIIVKLGDTEEDKKLRKILEKKRLIV